MGQGSRKGFRAIQELYRRVRDESRIPWLLFYMGLTIELLIVVVDKSNYINPYESYLFRITFALFAVKLLFTRYDVQRWSVILLLELLGFVSYRITGGNDIIRVVTFVAACKDIPLKQMLKYAFYVTLSGCAVVIMLSVTGLYGDVTLTQNFGRGNNPYEIYDGAQVAAEETRYTLGMGHPNALACMFLMVAAMGIYVYGEKLRWYGYLFIMLLNIGVYGLTGSKTSMIITSALIAGGCAMRYCRFLREHAFAYLCGLLVFVICIGFSVDAAASAQRVRQGQKEIYYYGTMLSDKSAHIDLLIKIDEKINGRIRSLTDTTVQDGTLATWSAFSGEHNMGVYFDMGWVKLFYRYGMVAGVLYCLACLCLLRYLYRNKDAFGLVVFVVLAVYTVIEAHLFSVYIGRNFLLMMMGYYLLGDSGWQKSKRKAVCGKTRGSVG